MFSLEARLDLEKKIASLTANLLDCFEELNLIYRLSARVLSTVDIEKQLGLVLDEAKDIFGADLVWFYLSALERTDCFSRCPDQSVQAWIDDLIVKPALQLGKTHTLYDLRLKYPEWGNRLPAAFLCNILKSGETVLGALCIGHLKPDQYFSAGDLKLANVMGILTSLALQNARMYHDLLAQEQARVRMDQEFVLAAQIQQSLLPSSPPQIPGYEFSGISRSARQIGGDYYDFMPRADGRISFCLADVAGKGLPASLLMANVQAAIRSQALALHSTEECLQQVNGLLCRNSNNGRFVTLFYGLLDPSAHLLEYGNAGHLHPIYLDGRGEARTLDGSGLVLGISDEARYRSDRLQIEPGGILLLFSDGVTESENPTGEFFGTERLLQLLCISRHRPLPELLAAVDDAVREFTGPGPATDDLTLLAVRRNPAG